MESGAAGHDLTYDLTAGGYRDRAQRETFILAVSLEGKISRQYLLHFSKHRSIAH
jgi:hypothetical protein